MIQAMINECLTEFWMNVMKFSAAAAKVCKEKVSNLIHIDIQKNKCIFEGKGFINKMGCHA